MLWKIETSKRIHIIYITNLCNNKVLEKENILTLVLDNITIIFKY